MGKQIQVDQNSGKITIEKKSGRLLCSTSKSSKKAINFIKISIKAVNKVRAISILPMKL